MVSLEFLNDVTNNAFATTVVWDQDGCQTGRNGNFVVPGGWLDSCLLGVTGDWMIRAVVDCPLEKVPTVSEWGVVVMTLTFLTAGSIVIARPWRPEEA